MLTLLIRFQQPFFAATVATVLPENKLVKHQEGLWRNKLSFPFSELDKYKFNKMRGFSQRPYNKDLYSWSTTQQVNRFVLTAAFIVCVVAL